jgi:hypothetical protein
MRPMGYNWTNQIMKKLILGLFAIVIVAMTSCSSVRIVPQAKSIGNAVRFQELNLTNADYSVLNTISAEATISVTYHSDKSIEVKDMDNTFSYKLKSVGKKGSGVFMLDKTEGVIRGGFLSNNLSSIDLTCPEDVSIGVALYRIISMSQQMGADGLVEPVMSTNIEGTSGSIGKMTVVYKTTVSAKPVKLKVTGK